LRRFDVRRIGRVLLICACWFLLATVIAYGGLIGLGRWQLDEYSDFRAMRAGFPFLLERMKWSPRPVSEPIYYAYGWCVNGLHRPLIVVVLGVLWLTFLFAGLFTSWHKQDCPPDERRRYLLLISLALMALFLAGGHTTEVFYWPAGAIAYLPTLAASLLLFLQVMDGRLNSIAGQTVSCICLIVAAGSSEAGATFTLCYGLLQAVRWTISVLRKRVQLSARSLWWWALPLGVAAFVLLTVRLGRFTKTELPELVARPTRGHLMASVRAACIEIVHEIAGMERLRPSIHLLVHSRIPMAVLLILGTALCWPQLRATSKKQAWQILEISAALVAASVLTIAAANLHLGITCCDRHYLVRECWIIMSTVGVVTAASAWMSPQFLERLRKASLLAPLLFCAAVLSLGNIGPLLRTYKHYPELRAAINQNFESGFNRASRVMVFSVLPSTGIVWEEPLPPGIYRAGSADVTGFSSVAYPYYILAFFGKQVLIVRRLEFLPGPTI
jgi:hypothetical protein